MRHAIVLSLAASALVASGCTTKKYDVDLDKLSSFRVELASGAPGTPDEPLAFAQTGGVPFGLTVQALDGLGRDMPWSGTVKISAVPGKVGNGAMTAEVVGGTFASTPIAWVTKAFGPTRIWVEDAGTSDAPGTYATGISPTIWFKTPDIVDVQTSVSTARSPFEGQLVTITSGTMMVTNITGDGFYVTDITKDAWNSIYAYARTRAEDLNRGMRVNVLSGAVSEYNGMTELNNPSWEPGEQIMAPEDVQPVVLDCETQVLAGGLAMEPYEASFVQVANATIQVCAAFPSCSDYTKYGQWTVTLPCGVAVNVISRLSVPSFDPAASRGKPMPVLRGTLTNVAPADPEWIIVPRDESDLCCPTCAPKAFDGACPPASP